VELWKVNRMKATRSVIVKLRNNTKYKLERHDYSLHDGHGHWSYPPAEQVSPKSSDEFGTESVGNFLGTQGFIGYQVQCSTSSSSPDSQPSDYIDYISFFWSNPYMGRFKTQTQTSKFHVSVEEISSCAATVTFTITEPGDDDDWVHIGEEETQPDAKAQHSPERQPQQDD